MKELEDILKALVGRTIVGCGTDDDELMFELDDGHTIWIWCEDDELYMTIDREGAQESH